MTENKCAWIVVIQPTLPQYRIDLFSRLSDHLGTRFVLYASDINMGTLTQHTYKPKWLRKLGPMRRLFFGAEWQVSALSIKISRGDVVVISGAPRCLSNLFLLVVARIRGARTIWWGQFWSATSRPHRFFLRIILMRLAHGVLFYTDEEVRRYRGSWGRYDRRPIYGINNGIDVEPIKKLRRGYSPNERVANIMFIGRITEKAKLDLLLRAMTNSSLARATLHVIGDGPDDGSLRQWTSQNGLDGRVKWYGGLIDERQIAEVANRCAVFCYPGGVGLSLIHAMAYGLPAVLHNDRSRHMPEIAAFETGLTGLDFSAGDANSLAERLGALLADPESLRRMSQCARERADSSYNTQEMTNRFLTITNRVVT